jgi:hypothetical protein
MSVPSIPTENLSTDNSQAPPTPHQKSGRRLSKSVMRSDSSDAEGSKGWGMVAMNDGSGTERAVRVVQKAEAEDFNMMKVSWVWTEDGQTNQIDLRHGRISGIRKIYVNKELITREGKSLRNLISDKGSTHYFEIGSHSACIDIRPKSGVASGFTYQLLVDENPIEQSLGGPTSDMGRLDIGTRAVQLPKTSDGLGMTLRNNPLGPTGVVVWTVEPGKAAERAGIGVGDVVLSIEDNIVKEIDHLVEYVSRSVGVVHMELAGTAQSRTVVLHKKPYGDDDKLPIGLGLQTTSCGIGILVTEIDPGSAAWACKESGGLRLGDAILSIDGTVPSSPKHAVNLILQAGQDGKYAAAPNISVAEPKEEAGGDGARARARPCETPWPHALLLLRACSLSARRRIDSRSRQSSSRWSTTRPTSRRTFGRGARVWCGVYPQLQVRGLAAWAKTVPPYFSTLGSYNLSRQERKLKAEREAAGQAAMSMCVCVCV